MNDGMCHVLWYLEKALGDKVVKATNKRHNRKA